jgi:hypothetical protein
MTDGEDIAIKLYWEGKEKEDLDQIDYIQRIRIEQGIRFGFRRALLYSKNKCLIMGRTNAKKRTEK